MHLRAMSASFDIIKRKDNKLSTLKDLEIGTSDLCVIAFLAKSKIISLGHISLNYVLRITNLSVHHPILSKEKISTLKNLEIGMFI